MSWCVRFSYCTKAKKIRSFLRRRTFCITLLSHAQTQPFMSFLNGSPYDIIRHIHSCLFCRKFESDSAAATGHSEIVMVTLSVPNTRGQMPLYIFAPGCCGRNYWSYGWLAKISTLAVARVHVRQDRSTRFQIDFVNIALALLTMSSQDSSVHFYQRLQHFVIFGGHSRGASLAMEHASAVTNDIASAYILFGDANSTFHGTTHSAHSTPMLFVDGDSDCITAKQRRQILQSPNNSVGTMVVINGAVHSQWATNLWHEQEFSRYASVSWCNARLTEKEQQEIAIRLIEAFVMHMVRMQSAGLRSFQDFLTEGLNSGEWAYVMHRRLFRIASNRGKCRCCDPASSQHSRFEDSSCRKS